MCIFMQNEDEFKLDFKKIEYLVLNIPWSGHSVLCCLQTVKQYKIRDLP